MLEFDDDGESEAIFSINGRFVGGWLLVWAGGGLFCPCDWPLNAVSQDCDDDDDVDDPDNAKDDAFTATACNFSAALKCVGLPRFDGPGLTGLLFLEFTLRLRPELFWVGERISAEQLFVFNTGLSPVL